MAKIADASWFQHCMVQNRVQVWLGTPGDPESDLIIEIDQSLLPALSKKLNNMLGTKPSGMTTKDL